MKIALAQLNPTIADLSGNAEKIYKAANEAHSQGAALAIFPELSLCAYPPRDLLLREWFIRDVVSAAKALAKHSKQMPFVFGAPWPSPYPEGKPLVNAAILARDGKIEKFFPKKLLPEYDVFDERRYFEPGREKKPNVFGVGKTRFGVTICEDLWEETNELGHLLHAHSPSPTSLLKGKCDILLNLAASPFHLGKYKLRQAVLQKAARILKKPVLYVNQVGGHDDLLFDGRSQAIGANGKNRFQLKAFDEELYIYDTEARSKSAPAILHDPGEIQLLRQALVLGLRDYFRKTGFQKAVLGLSGGIDSALVAALAAEALGPDKVTCVTMPSPYSSTGSVDDSVDLAKRLGIHLDNISIAEVMDVFGESLKAPFGEQPSGLAWENLQSRIRGNVLMAYANRENALVLNTGNKSELAMGYCTLYGDMNGGLSVLGDLTKTRVYALARHFNSKKEVIPRAIIDKEPSAELRPGQKDTDSLPPYDVLDPIVEALVEENVSAETLVKRGFKKDLATSVIRKFEINEYKRFQSPPILKVTSKAFGPGRRIPLARKF
ncbi:MAG: NAD+ synthase [Spirochaetia bacterium]|nr:NAD+ synthase [Spirochaetia bacterium]